jgi:hypothetical protein
VHSVVKRKSAIILALVLAACGAPPPKPPVMPTVPGPAAATEHPAALGQAAGPPDGSRYRIDSAQSELRVLVYRAGPMASLGHNHVISCRCLEGWATFRGDASSAAFALSLPVTAFVVDDPALRREEGSDFAGDVTDDARAGTLHNMLGPAVLDAANVPAIRISSVEVAAAAGSLQARVALEVGGHESTLVVPFALDALPGRLVARGELTLTQSSLGLTPFSVFLGALTVQDELRVRFIFVAVAG